MVRNGDTKTIKKITIFNYVAVVTIVYVQPHILFSDYLVVQKIIRIQYLLSHSFILVNAFVCFSQFENGGKQSNKSTFGINFG